MIPSQLELVHSILHILFIRIDATFTWTAFSVVTPFIARVCVLLEFHVAFALADFNKPRACVVFYRPKVAED